MVSDKYIEADIKPEELEKLYQNSDLSPDLIASQFNISKEMFYKIINGKEANPNDKRKHEMKQFFLKTIFKDQNRATV